MGNPESLESRYEKETNENSYYSQNIYTIHYVYWLEDKVQSLEARVHELEEMFNSKESKNSKDL